MFWSQMDDESSTSRPSTTKTMKRSESSHTVKDANFGIMDPEHAGIQELDLSWNQIKGHGAEDLFHAMESPACVLSVSLQDFSRE